jgi:hypothetical protein
MNQEWLTTEEVMKAWRIKSKSTLNRYHKMGLKYVKSRPNLYRKEELDRFFMSQER